MTRPAAADLAVMFLEHDRLRPVASRHVTSEIRCPGRRHPLAFVLSTVHGPWAMWRGTPIGRGGWVCGWVDEHHEPVPVSCNCTATLIWRVDLHTGDITALP